LSARAKAAGLSVLLDAKRGDIGSTAEGYVDAYRPAGRLSELDILKVSVVDH